MRKKSRQYYPNAVFEREVVKAIKKKPKGKQIISWTSVNNCFYLKIYSECCFERLQDSPVDRPTKTNNTYCETPCIWNLRVFE